jgi:hypothetical protein
MNKLLLAILFTTLSCNEAVSRKSLQSFSSSQGAHSGYNQQNSFTQCSAKNSKGLCPQLKKIDPYAYECSNKGYQVINCDCGEYLCSKPLSNYPPPSRDSNDSRVAPQIPLGNILSDSSIVYSGKDFYGNNRECSSIPKDRFCDMEFTEKDAYGLDCREKGFDIVKCDCHDPICLK